MKVGSISVESIIDGVGLCPPTTMYARLGGRGSIESDWAPHREFLNEEGLVELSVGGFLIRTNDRVVLVDLGIRKWPENSSSTRITWTTGKLMENLHANDVEPRDLTDIVFTHLHFDHIGWASEHGYATFPSATYRCDERDWDYFFPRGRGVRNADIAERLDPITNRWDFWDCDKTILPGLDALGTPGHTPGSTTIVISSGEERALLLGDVVHCPVELVDSEWGQFSEVDPKLAMQSREAMVRELEGGFIPAAAAHFPGMQFGRLINARGKRRWIV